MRVIYGNEGFAWNGQTYIGPHSPNTWGMVWYYTTSVCVVGGLESYFVIRQINPWPPNPTFEVAPTIERSLIRT